MDQVSQYSRDKRRRCSCARRSSVGNLGMLVYLLSVVHLDKLPTAQLKKPSEIHEYFPNEARPTDRGTARTLWL